MVFRVTYPWFVFVVASPMLCHVFKLIITQLKNIDLQINCEGSKWQKERQVQRQIHDECYPAKFLPVESKKNKTNKAFKQKNAEVGYFIILS